jgi:glucose/arabinose dehydrogenase
MHVRLIQACLLLAVASCGASGPSSAQAGNAAQATVTDPGRPFTATPVATFDRPWAIAFLPGSTMALVTEQPGRIWLVDAASGRKTAVGGAPQVRFGGQGGLLDIALSPHFAADGLVYVSFSRPTPDGGSGLALSRAKLVRGADGARLEDMQLLWSDPEGGQGGQFGARIAFAPDGNSLFLSSGERQRFTPAQDPSQPLGKILHLTLDGKPAAGNPLAGRTGAKTVTITDPPKDTEIAKGTSGRTFAWPGPNLTPAETWSTGHRNAYGLMFAPDGRLWETEMGPRGGDEVNLIEPGRNYGWPNVSNGSNYDGVPIPDHRPGDGFEAPRVWWNPSVSPSGLLIYTGGKFPQWRGDAMIPTLSGKSLIRVDIDGDKARKADEWAMGARIRGIAQGPDGAVYLLEDGPDAKLLRLEPSAQSAG